MVLERGEVANSWKTERWDSLRLLTPNWLSRLPGYGYEGDDPDGFRTMPETIDFIEKYAAGDLGSGPDPHPRIVGATRPTTDINVSTDQGNGNAGPWSWPPGRVTFRASRRSRRHCLPGSER